MSIDTPVIAHGGDRDCVACGAGELFIFPIR